MGEEARVQWTGEEDVDLSPVGLRYVPGHIERIDGGIDLRTDDGTVTVGIGDWIVRSPDGTLSVERATHQTREDGDESR